MSKDIKTYIKEELSIKLHELEAYRKKLLNQFIMLMIILTGILIFIIYSLSISDLSIGIGWIHICVGYGVGSYLIYKYIFNKNFRLKYKNALITKAFHYFDPNITYDPKSFISEESFKQSMIFQNRSWNRYSGEDLVKGTYNDIEFCISEILAQHKTGGKNSSATTIFDGLFLDAYLHQSIDGYLVLSFKKHGLGQIGDAFNSFLKGVFGMKEKLKEYNGIKDSDFNDTYSVYCNHSFIADSILTPDFIDNVKKLWNNYKMPIVLSFVDDHFYIATPSKKNLFEASIRNSILKLDHIEAEMNKYMDLIDTLKVLNIKQATKRVTS